MRLPLNRPNSSYSWRLFVSLLTTGLLSACSSNQPSFDYDYDQEFNFASLKTYRWYDDVRASQLSEYRHFNGSDKRIREAVDQELRRKGLVEGEGDNVDFWLNYQKSSQKTQRISGQDGGVHGGVGMGTYGNSVGVGYSTGPSVRVYEDGTAILDVIDAKTRKIVWRGIAEGRLKNDRDLSDKRRATVEVASRLLAAFPPETPPE